MRRYLVSGLTAGAVKGTEAASDGPGSACMSEDRHTIRGNGITASVLAHGAELCSLKTAEGLELCGRPVPNGGVTRRCCFRSSAGSRVIGCAIAANPTR